MQAHKVTGFSILGSTAGMTIAQYLHAHGWHVLFTVLLGIIGVVRTLASEKDCQPKIDALMEKLEERKNA